jgi:hypothetical protein
MRDKINTAPKDAMNSWLVRETPRADKIAPANGCHDRKNPLQPVFDLLLN